MNTLVAVVTDLAMSQPDPAPAGFHSMTIRIKMSAMLKARLLGIMQREVKSRDLRLSMYCMQRIELIVGQGIQRMRINSASEHAGYAMQAERNLKAFIRHLADYSRDLGTYPQLSDADFDAALAVSPNVWPFRSST